MSALHLYAITESPWAPEGVAGLDGMPVRAVHGRTLSALVSDRPAAGRSGPAPATPDAAALHAHAAVVEAAMADATLLPVRFGTAVAGEEAVRHLLDDRAAEFTARLDAVRGATEVGVRALWEPEEGDAPPAGGPGTRFLLGRLDRRRRAEALAGRIHRPLAELARSARHRLLATPRLLLGGAYLVDAGTEDDFRERVADLEADLDVLAIRFSGPWPPYSFVEPAR